MKEVLERPVYNHEVETAKLTTGGCTAFGNVKIDDCITVTAPVQHVEEDPIGAAITEGIKEKTGHTLNVFTDKPMETINAVKTG